MNKRTLLAVVLAYLLPGAGHLYLGKRSRAAVFAVIIPMMLVVGLALRGNLYVYEPGRPLTFFAMIGSMGAGIPYFVGRALGPFRDVLSATYEYGTAFTLTAGLMNLMLILDVFDISVGRKE